jgi:hypothetical protein
MHLLNPNTCIQWTLFDEAMEAASGRPPARPLGRNLEERPRLFGTNLHEIGIAIVAVAVTMVIWFYASSLGFTPT